MAASTTQSRRSAKSYRSKGSHKPKKPPGGRYIDTFNVLPTDKLRKDLLRFGTECTLDGITTYHKDERTREICLDVRPPALQLPDLTEPINMLEGWEEVQGELMTVPTPLCDEILRILPATIGSNWRESHCKYTFVSFRRTIRSILALSLSHLAARNGSAQAIVWLESVERTDGILKATLCFENIQDLENNNRFSLPKHKGYGAGHAFETLVAGVPMRMTGPDSDRRLMELTMANVRIFFAGEVDARFPEEKDEELPRLCELKARNLRSPSTGDVSISSAYFGARLWEKYLQCFLGECDLMIGYHNEGLLDHIQEYRTEDILESLGGVKTRDQALTVLNDVLEFVGQTVLEECALGERDQFSMKKLFRLQMTRGRESSRFSVYEVDRHDFDWFHGDLIGEMKKTNMGFVVKNANSPLNVAEVPGGFGQWNIVTMT